MSLSGSDGSKCGPTPSTACKSIERAVRVAESSKEHSHKITIDGGNAGGNMYVLQSNVSLTKSYHFTSSNASIPIISGQSSKVVRAFIMKNNILDFSVERVNFKIGAVENEKTSGGSEKLGSISLKNCKFDTNSEVVYLKGSIKAVGIQDCVINITNGDLYAIELASDVDEVVLNRSTIWGNFLQATVTKINISLKMFHFKIFKASKYAVYCGPHCSDVMIKNGTFESCSGGTAIHIQKVRIGEDFKDCSNLSMDDVSFLKSTFSVIAQLWCVNFNMRNIKISGNQVTGYLSDAFVIKKKRWEH